jgi:hypothetical protein
MEDIDLVNAVIAAALIQSGQFKLSNYDEQGRPMRGDHGSDADGAERLMRMAENFANPEFDAFASPALTTLRKLTNAIRRALYEAPPSVSRG